MRGWSSWIFKDLSGSSKILTDLNIILICFHYFLLLIVWLFHRLRFWIRPRPSSIQLDQTRRMTASRYMLQPSFNWPLLRINMVIFGCLIWFNFIHVNTFVPTECRVLLRSGRWPLRTRVCLNVWNCAVCRSFKILINHKRSWRISIFRCASVS